MALPTPPKPQVWFDFGVTTRVHQKGQSLYEDDEITYVKVVPQKTPICSL